MTSQEPKIKNQNLKTAISPRVFVGMSGGVDSSVSATLLKKQGFDVTGVFIKTWTPDWLKCTWKEERLDAMRVCAKLDIPFITLDLEKEYKRNVVDYMIREYKAGKTPNPDIMCNKYIKFGAFFDFAMKKGADFIATGHYARVYSKDSPSKGKKGQLSRLEKKTKYYKLLVGCDDNKDQSYFLWTLTQKHLSKTLFPVGDLLKSEVRKLAKKFDLPTAEKKDSQGICFLGKIDMKSFLSHYIKSKKGKVFNEKGEEIGFHNGSVFLTIGERHGFTITKKTSNDEPYFIVEKNAKRNAIIVSHKSCEQNPFFLKKEFVLKDVNWISKNNLNEFKSSFLECRVRYRQPFQRLKIKDFNFETKNYKNKMKIEFEGIQTVASGQSVVFYKEGECLGGGVVEK